MSSPSQRLQPDGSFGAAGPWLESSGLDFASQPSGSNPLPGISPAACSAANRATLDAMLGDLTSALGGDGATAAAIIADLENRIDVTLGV